LNKDKKTIAPQASAGKKHNTVSENKLAKKVISQIKFQIRYRTSYGQEIFVCGNHPLLGNGDPLKAASLYFNNDDLWSLNLDFSKSAPIKETLRYHYIIRNEDGSLSFDAGNDKEIDPSKFDQENIYTIDSWNYAGYQENAFYTEPFVNVLLKANHTEVKLPTNKK